MTVCLVSSFVTYREDGSEFGRPAFVLRGRGPGWSMIEAKQQLARALHDGLNTIIATTQSPRLRESMTAQSKDAVDLVVVPAQNDGFQRVFLGQNAWHAIRIREDLLESLKYIAAYQCAPVSAITHYAVIDRIEPYDAKGSGTYHTYRLVFRGSAKQITPIPYADATPGMIQGPRYTSLARLLAAKTLKNVF